MDLLSRNQRLFSDDRPIVWLAVMRVKIPHPERKLAERKLARLDPRSALVSDLWM